jgi:tetratricopeptide (TPR) repeat protein
LRRALAPGRLQLQHDLSGGVAVHALVPKHRAGDVVAAQSFQLLAAGHALGHSAQRRQHGTCTIEANEERQIGIMSKQPTRCAARPPVAAKDVDVKKLLDEGRALHAQGRVNDAFVCYQAALRAAPDDAEALHLTGVAYLSMGLAPLGIGFIRRAIDRRPDVAAYRVNLATSLAQQGCVDEAVAQLEAACALQPDDARAHAGLAALHLRGNRCAEAERHYAAANALEPQHAEWHQALARLYYQRWAMPEALASAARACELPLAPASRLNMGWALPKVPAPRPSPAPMLKAAAISKMGDLERACAELELLVFDDFLADPLAYRGEALRLCKREAEYLAQVNFPGVQTPPQQCAATMQRIADALGRPLKWDSPDHGALRVSLANDDARADVHVDNPTLPNIFGGVLYLSLPEHARGGTRFYRHRATGWDRRPDEAALRERGDASFLAFQKRNLPPNRRLPFSQWQRQRDTVWECLFEVPMRFNRLIVFRSDFFHAITELFGDRAENGRLAQLFHFESQG